MELALAYGSEVTKGKRMDWSIRGSVIWMGDGKIAQTAQEVRTKEWVRYEPALVHLRIGGVCLLSIVSQSWMMGCGRN